MTAVEPGAGTGYVRGGRVWAIGAASIVAATLTWGLQAIAGRALGPVGYASFMVVWGFVFFEIGLLLGVQQEVTRAVANATHTSARKVVPGTRPLTLGLVIGGAGGGVLLVTSPLWANRLFGDRWPGVTLALTCAFVVYAVYNAANGGLAGRSQWHDYALSITSEGLLRFVLVGAALVLAGGLPWQTWGLAGAGLTWLVLAGRSAFRQALTEPTAGGLPDLTRGAMNSMMATGCSALVISGFPVLLRVTADGPLAAEGGVVLAAIIATRAPLLLPLNAFSAVLLTRFVSEQHRIIALLVRLSVTVLAITALGAALAVVIGPWTLRLLYGAAFDVGGLMLALLVTAAGLLTVQTMSGMAVLATGAQAWYAAGWVLATVASVLLLVLPMGVEERATLALLVGPVVGLLVNAVVLDRQQRKASQAS
jgi:O-antigen/teichoic acid export membrane protein